MEKILSYKSVISPEDQKTWDDFISRVDWNATYPIQPIHQPPKTILDLHGLTIQTAWQQTINFIKLHKIHKTKSIIVVTGKSGEIFKEFVTWAKLNPLVKKIEPILDRRQEVGSFRVYLN